MTNGSVAMRLILSRHTDRHCVDSPLCTLHSTIHLFNHAFIHSLFLLLIKYICIYVFLNWYVVVFFVSLHFLGNLYLTLHFYN